MVVLVQSPNVFVLVDASWSVLLKGEQRPLQIHTPPHEHADYHVPCRQCMAALIVLLIEC